MSLLDAIIPISLIIKVIVIIVIGLVTVFGAYFIPKGKIFVIIGGIIAIIIMWYVDLGI